jgi:diguanylate cyclase
VAGVEALVRWQHPRHGLLMPDKFLGPVKQSGLIGALTMSVLDQALAQHVRWAREGIHLSVAVNLSAANLLDDDLAAKVASVIARHGAEPGGLVLEITEDCVMTDTQKSLRVLAELQALGIELSIDDYGTGFSSLSYLRDLPASELKLDRSFLTGLTDDDRVMSIVRSTVELAHSLGLRLVAEGVETEAELDLVTRLGCDGVQGYLLSRPVPGPELVRRLQEGRFPLVSCPGAASQPTELDPQPA